MISRLPTRFASVALMLFVGPWSIPAGAQELSAKELRRAVKSADKALGAGSYQQALKLYNQILASTSGVTTGAGE